MTSAQNYRDEIKSFLINVMHKNRYNDKIVLYRKTEQDSTHILIYEFEDGSKITIKLAIV